MTQAPPPFVSLDAQVSITGLSEGIQRSLHQSWGYPSADPVCRTITITQAPQLSTPAGQRREVLVARTPLSVWVEEDEVWIEEKLHLQVRPHDVHLTVTPDQVSGEAWLLAFSEAHRVGGWLPLHAAVLAQGQHAVAITGVSGAGKSTAALRLAGVGVQVLAEDQVWIWPRNRCVVGFDLHLRAFDDSVQTFAPQLLTEARGRDTHGKLLLPLIQPGGQATVHDLLILGLPPVLSTVQRVQALWETSGVPLTHTGRLATAAGISMLLPQLGIHGVSRENVLDEVQHKLASSYSSG